MIIGRCCNRAGRVMHVASIKDAFAALLAVFKSFGDALRLSAMP